MTTIRFDLSNNSDVSILGCNGVHSESDAALCLHLYPLKTYALCSHNTDALIWRNFVDKSVEWEAGSISYKNICCHIELGISPYQRSSRGSHTKAVRNNMTSSLGSETP